MGKNPDGTLRIDRDYSKKTTVTRKFREALLKLYPGLNISESYRKLAAILLFSMHRDKDTNEVIIPYDVLADIEDRETDYLNSNYNALSFLRRFQSDVMTPETFTWSGWSWDEGKARTAKVIWKPELIEALKLEIPARKNKDVPKVLLSTGESYSTAKKRNEYEQRRTESLRIIAETEPAAKGLLTYLDNRSSRIYTTKFLENIDKTVAEIQKDSDTASRDYNLRVLKEIERITKPIYSPSKTGKTDRVFAGSWMLLSREYRNLLTQGWISYDLKYSQVAICAKLWGITEVQSFLLSGGNVWKEICNHLSIDYGLKTTNRALFDEIKSPLKDALYSLIYGKRLNDIKNELAQNTFLKQHCGTSPQSFLDNGIIQALFAAREKQKKRIIKAKYVGTCFGRKLPLIYESKRKSNIKSLMAIQAQALELQLLLPVIAKIKNTTECQVVLWAHDGFYVWYRDLEKEKTWEPRIISTVAGEISKHGVITELERQDT